MIFHGSHGIALKRSPSSWTFSSGWTFATTLRWGVRGRRGGGLRTIPGLVNVYSLRTGKSPFLIGKSTLNRSFSIAMLVYHRVTPSNVYNIFPKMIGYKLFPINKTSPNSNDLPIILSNQDPNLLVREVYCTSPRFSCKDGSFMWFVQLAGMPVLCPKTVSIATGWLYTWPYTYTRYIYRYI